MTLTEYLNLRLADGLSLTRTVDELSGTLGVTQRAVWQWVKARKAPQHVERLLSVLVEATPEQKARWFA